VEQQQAQGTDLLSLTAKSALTSTSDSKRLMVRQVSARSRLKAAIMTVSGTGAVLYTDEAVSYAAGSCAGTSVICSRCTFDTYLALKLCIRKLAVHLCAQSCS
jgi:hypothetical protein